MPEISRFFGMVVSMYHNDHGPPHFHVRYGGQAAVFAIVDGELLEGTFSPRLARHIKEWAELHYEELVLNWELARQEQILHSIEPLK
jgi:hypothetical protein